MFLRKLADANSGNRSRPAVRLVVRLRHVSRRARKRPSPPRKSRTPCSTRSWPRKKSGFAQGIKARRTRNEGRVRALGRNAPRRGSDASSSRGTVQARRSERAAQRRAGRRGRRRVVRLRRAADRAQTFRRRSCAATRSASSAATAPARRRCCACCSANSPPQIGHGAARHESADRLLRPTAAAARRRSVGAGERRRRLRRDLHRRQAAAHHRLPAGLSVQRRTGPHAGASFSPAANGTACCWRSCSPSRRT